MSDVRIIEEMLERAKIEYTNDAKDALEAAEHHKDRVGTSLIVEAGYLGFYTVFRFRKDGSLKSIEAYE